MVENLDDDHNEEDCNCHSVKSKAPDRSLFWGKSFTSDSTKNADGQSF
jgi:hypothetical protein